MLMSHLMLILKNSLLKKKRKNVGKISWNMHPGETLNRTLYTENFGRI